MKLFEDGDPLFAPQLNALFAAFRGTAVMAGCEASATGTSRVVSIAAGQVQINGNAVNVGSGSVTLDTGSTFDRYDLISVDASGSKIVTKGATKRKCPTQPADTCLLAIVFVLAGATVIATGDVYDTRMLASQVVAAALTLTESSTPGLLMIYPTNSIIWQSSIPRSTSSGLYTELKRVTSSHTGSIRIRLTVSTSSDYTDSGTIGIVVGGRLQAEVGADIYGAVTKTVDVIVGAGEIISFQGRVSDNRATVTLTNIQLMGSLGCVPYSTQTPTITVNVD